MSLANLPSELFVPIARRVQPSTLCRLRQTCKAMDNFVEKERFVIRNEPSLKEWILNIQVVAITKPKLRISVFSASSGEIDWSSQWTDSFGLWKNTHKKGRISDAYKQIPAIKFNVVIVKFNYRGGTFEESEETCRKRQDEYYFGEMLPLIGDLRLECERLCLENVKPEKLCPLIRFNRLHTKIRALAEDMKKWPIWHCVEHDIFGLTTIKNEEFGLDDEPIELSPLVRHISKASFHFSGNWAMESAMSLERFLMAAQKDRSVRGKLEFLRILYFCNKEDFDSLAETVEAVSLLAGGLPFKYEPMWNHCGYNWIIITKFQIDGGFALILTQAAYNHVYFLNEYNRSVLLDIIFPWFFPNVPWDLSANYEDFMGALDDEAAIASLYDYYRPIYFDWLDRTEEERQREREANRGQTQWPVEWHDSDNEDEEANGAYHKHQYVVFETEVSDKFFM